MPSVEAVGELEAFLASTFARLNSDQASGRNPLLYFDHLHLIGRHRQHHERVRLSDESSDDDSLTQINAIGSLLPLVEGATFRIIASTHRIGSIDPALRRPGRFDLEIAWLQSAAPVDLENGPLRRQVQRWVAQQGDVGMYHISEAIQWALVERIYASLCSNTDSTTVFALWSQQLTLSAFNVITQSDCDSFDISTEQLVNTAIPICRKLNCGAALRLCNKLFEQSSHASDPLPAQQPQHSSPIPGVFVDDHVAFAVIRTLLWPIHHASTFVKLNLQPPRGILLHGPPGCGKTSIVRAATAMAGSTFINVNISDVLSSYVGDSERYIRSVFARARTQRPCVIFIDEIDGLVTRRSDASDALSLENRLLATLLTEMDGLMSSSARITCDDVNKLVQSGAASSNWSTAAQSLLSSSLVQVVAATNRLSSLDEALLRPGRLDEIIEIPLPSNHLRRSILRHYCRTLPLHMQPDSDFVDLDVIADALIGCSGADIEARCRKAVFSAINNQRVEIFRQDFL